MSYETRKKITNIMRSSDSPVTLISELQDVCSSFKDIEFLKDPDPLLPYTCLQYCVNCLEDGVERYNAYVTLKEYSEHSESIDMKFLEWMIQNEYMVSTDKKLAIFVTYWENLKPHHIGFLNGNGIVTSKWGVGGPLVKHGIFEVPSSYGSIAKWHEWSGDYNIIQLLNQFLGESFGWEI